MHFYRWSIIGASSTVDGGGDLIQVYCILSRPYCASDNSVFRETCGRVRGCRGGEGLSEHAILRYTTP